jgi:hypothetical protein
MSSDSAKFWVQPDWFLESLLVLPCLMLWNTLNSHLRQRTTFVWKILFIYTRGRSQWPRGLRHRSTVTHLLRLGAWKSVCCECCALSGRSHCDKPTIRPEEFYRLCFVAVCDIETSSMRSQTSINCDWNQNRRYNIGCISCMPLILTVNTIAECPRTDCNIQGVTGGTDQTSGGCSLC